MKRASLLLPFVLVGSGFLFLACASGDSDVGFGGAGGGAVTQAASTTVAVTTTVAATVTSTSTTGGCIPSCGIDADCANTCPAVQAGQSNCCDSATNMCYVNSSAQCPIPGTTTATSSSTGY